MENLLFLRRFLRGISCGGTLRVLTRLFPRHVNRTLLLLDSEYASKSHDQKELPGPDSESPDTAVLGGAYLSRLMEDGSVSYSKKFTARGGA